VTTAVGSHPTFPLSLIAIGGLSPISHALAVIRPDPDRKSPSPRFLRPLIPTPQNLASSPPPLSLQFGNLLSRFLSSNLRGNVLDPLFIQEARVRFGAIKFSYRNFFPPPTLLWIFRRPLPWFSALFGPLLTFAKLSPRCPLTSPAPFLYGPRLHPFFLKRPTYIGFAPFPPPFFENIASTTSLLLILDPITGANSTFPRGNLTCLNLHKRCSLTPPLFRFGGTGTSGFLPFLRTPSLRFSRLMALFSPWKC